MRPRWRSGSILSIGGSSRRWPGTTTACGESWTHWSRFRASGFSTLVAAKGGSHGPCRLGEPRWWGSTSRRRCWSRRRGCRACGRRPAGFPSARGHSTRSSRSRSSSIWIRGRETSFATRRGGVLAIVDKNIAALDAQRPWLPSALVKRIDEYRGRWMYPARGLVRERWFWPSGFQAELARRFKDVRIVRLLAPAEERTWLFRRLPAARLMTLWTARVPGGDHV